MKEISLSFTKFIELTEKYDYFIEQVFCLEDNCKCILLKTPKYSKLFLIYIPSKYIMEFPQNRNIVVNGREITDIKKDIFSYEIINKKPLEVITQYKLENLATVSSGLVCLYLNNKFECYTIGKSVGKRKNKDDELANLEYKTREILTKVKEFSKEKKEFLKPEDLKNLYAPPVDKSNAPNIVFVEDDGTVIEKNGPIEQMAVAAMGLSPKKETPPPEKVSLTETSKSIHDLEEKLSSKVAPEKVSKALRKLKREKRRQKALSLDEESEDISEDVSETSSIASTRHDSPEYKPKVHMEEIETQPNIGINMLPPEIELKNIMNGAIYVIVNINYFFSSIEEYETEIFAMYEKINTRDDEIRFEKMVNIETLIDEMKKKMKEQFSELLEEEIQIKENLNKCSRLLLTCISMKDRIVKKKILEKDLPEVEQLSKETKSKIETLNLQLLEQRDNIDQFLDDCKRVVDDYLNDNSILNLQ